MSTAESPHSWEEPDFDTTVDLNNCDREPIHVPGVVQSFARVVVFEPDSGVITHDSEPGEAISLDQLFDGDLLTAAGAAVRAAPTTPVTLWTGVRDGLATTITVHVHQGRGFLVFEPAARSRPSLGSVATVIQRIEAAQAVPALLEQLVAGIQALTGFDRVMAYVFDRDGDGTVAAEVAAEGLESFRGLRYPATDIPRQARRLFVTDRARVIADVDDTPRPLLPVGSGSGAVDLTHVVSRGVSPIHLTYLRNMGVRASMSLALVEPGTDTLWGLVACHHYQGPLVLDLDARLLASMITSSATLAIHALERRKLLADDAKHDESLAAITRTLAERTDLVEGMQAAHERLNGLFDTEGFAVVTPDRVLTDGRVPPMERLRRITDELATTDAGEVFATDRLPIDGSEPALPGVLGFQLANHPGTTVLWFREEEERRITWGGRPEKGTDPAGNLTPRASFEAYIESIRGRARPWSRLERRRAERLSTGLRDVLFRERARAAAIHGELLERRADLQTFANLASHDLREPIRAIGNYATFLREDLGEIDAESSSHLDAIDRLVRRTYSLIEGMLTMSRLGQLPIEYEPVALDEVVHEVTQDLRDRIREREAIIEVGALPVVHTWAFGLRTVLANLITNALKYNEEQPHIHIEHRETTSVPSRPSSVGDDHVVIAVTDNGIGIEPHAFRSIFRMFHRLHRGERFPEGTGAGLAIIQRVIERLDGQVWLDSTPKLGSTFYISIPSGVRE